jgi:hypothetical protein
MKTNKNYGVDNMTQLGKSLSLKFDRILSLCQLLSLGEFLSESWQTA